MAVSVIYFFVVLGLGLICVIIGFISGPNRLRKPVLVSSVPVANMEGVYTGFDYQSEKQIFSLELKKKLMEQKPNKGEDYHMEKERRDVVAFSEYCKVPLLRTIMPEIPNNERS